MSTISQFGGGGVKSIQRATVGAAGTYTITAVNTSKTLVHSISKGSAGTVAATGTVAAHTVNHSGTISDNGSAANGLGIYTWGINSPGPTNWAISPMAFNLGGYSTSQAANISGGTTNLVTKQYSAVLTNSTTITTDGACEFQVVEYY